MKNNKDYAPYWLDFQPASLGDLVGLIADALKSHADSRRVLVTLTDIEYRNDVYCLINVISPPGVIYWNFNTSNKSFSRAQARVWGYLEDDGGLQMDPAWKKHVGRLFRDTARSRAEKCILSRAFYGITAPWGGPHDKKYCDDDQDHLGFMRYRSSLIPAAATEKLKSYLQRMLAEFGKDSFRKVDLDDNVRERSIRANNRIMELFRDRVEPHYTKEEIRDRINQIRHLDVEDWLLEYRATAERPWNHVGSLRYAADPDLQADFMALGDARVEWTVEHVSMMRLQSMAEPISDARKQRILQNNQAAINEEMRLQAKIQKHLQRYKVIWEEAF